MTASDAPRPAANVTDVLAAHRLVFRTLLGRERFYCTCEKWVAVIVADGRDGDGVRKEDQHRAHVAAILEAGPVAEAERRGAQRVLAAVEKARGCGDPIQFVLAARAAAERGAS